MSYSSCKIVTGILCLLLACAIYLLLRSESINLYRWCQATVGTAALQPLRQWAQGCSIPNFVRYSLPDGLWCAAYILIADGIWHNEKTPWRHVVATAIPVIAIAHETMQMAGIAKGTFDPIDMLCYALPLAAYITLGARTSTSASVADVDVRAPK